MLKVLLRVRMAALASMFTGAARGKKAQSKGKLIGFAFLMLYCFGALGFMFWHYFSVLGQSFGALGLNGIFFSMTGLCTFSLMFAGSVFFAKAQLYEAKDNELLLSMPVRPGDILLSRLCMLMVVNLAFGLPAVVPAAIIGVKYMAPGGAGLAAFVLLFALLPFFALAVSALAGWALSILTARVKHKSIVATVLCVVLILGYSWFMARLNTTVMDIASHADDFAAALGAVAPVYWFGAAIADGNMGHMLAVTALFIAVSALTYMLLSSTFIRTATSNRGFSKNRYVERRTKTASADAALLRRELARFSSSSAYIVNAGLGLIFLLIAAAALLIKRSAVLELIAAVPQLRPFIAPLLILALCFLSAMNLISAPSVSMEGQNLWIVRSLPVDAFQVLRAKLRVHLLLGLPPVLTAGLVCLCVFKLTAGQAVLLLALPTAMTVFVGLLGLAENLRHPNLDWANEAQAVKTGLGLLYTMLISWAVLALTVLVVHLTGELSSYSTAAWGLLGLLTLASLLLLRWLRSGGAERFRRL